VGLSILAYYTCSISINIYARQTYIALVDAIDLIAQKELASIIKQEVASIL